MSEQKAPQCVKTWDELPARLRQAADGLRHAVVTGATAVGYWQIQAYEDAATRVTELEAELQARTHNYEGLVMKLSIERARDAEDAATMLSRGEFSVKAFAFIQRIAARKGTT